MGIITAYKPLGKTNQNLVSKSQNKGQENQQT